VAVERATEALEHGGVARAAPPLRGLGRLGYTPRMPTDEDRAHYRQAYEDWQRQLEALHAFLLGGQAPRGPDAIKGLFNREERAKQRYDAARLRLLGLEAEPSLPTPEA